MKTTTLTLDAGELAYYTPGTTLGTAGDRQTIESIESVRAQPNGKFALAVVLVAGEQTTEQYVCDTLRTLAATQEHARDCWRAASALWRTEDERAAVESTLVRLAGEGKLAWVNDPNGLFGPVILYAVPEARERLLAERRRALGL